MESQTSFRLEQLCDFEQVAYLGAYFSHVVRIMLSNLTWKDWFKIDAYHLTSWPAHCIPQ